MRRLIGLRGSALSRCMLSARPTTRITFGLGHAAGHQSAARGIGAVGRQLPVAVGLVAVGVDDGVGVARQA